MVVNIPISEIFPTLSATSESESTKRLLVVLNAVTDVIKAKNAPIQPTSYFALLLASLNENSYKQGQKHDLLKLLSLVITRISIGVVRSHGDSIIQMMSKNIESELVNENVVKPSLVLIGHVLTHADVESWNALERRQALSLLLSSAVDDRSKVRHRALQQVVLVLNSIGVSNTRSVGLNKSIAQLCCQFCLEVFEHVSSATMQKAFYTLAISHELIPLLPPSLISELVEAIIRVSQLGNSAITPICYKTIGSLFIRTNQLRAPHIQQLIDVLHSQTPNGIDHRSIVTYTELLTLAYLHFHRLDRTLSNQHIHNYFKNLMSNFSSDNQDLNRVTMDGFRNIIFECINEDVIAQADTQAISPLKTIVETFESGTKLTYRHSWELILRVVSALYEQLGPKAHPLLNNILVGVDAMNQVHDVRCRPAIHQLFGTVISAIGPKNFLAVLPLNLDAPPHGKERINRGWLLQILHDHIKCTDLQFFIDYFLPMTKTIRNKSKESESDGKVIEAKNLMILYQQIWELLPGFMNRPRDLVTSFKAIAKTLGTTLQDEPTLRSVVCMALTHMINQLVEARDTKSMMLLLPLRTRHLTMSQQLAEDSIKSVAQFAKNYLPIMFNIFPVSTHEQRSNIIDTIEAYVSITDTNTLNSLFKNLVTKLLEALAEEGVDKKDDKMKDDTEAKTKPEEKKKSKKYYLTDLTVGFVKHLDEENIRTLYKVIKPQLKCSDSGLQKRSFKVLVKMCEHHPHFIVQSMDKLRSILVTDLMQCASNIKKTRLKCLREVIVTISKEGDKNKKGEHDDEDEELEEDNKEAMPRKLKTSWTQLKKKFIPSILPDILLCTKESNNRLRELANELLIECGNIVCMIGSKLAIPKRGVSLEDTIHQSQKESISEYITLVAGGLGSQTPGMVSATVIALTRVIHNFRRMVDKALVIPMLSMIMVLTKSQNRDIVKAVLGLVRVVMACFKDEDLIEQRKKERSERKKEEAEANMNKMVDPVTGKDVRSVRGSTYGGDDDDEQIVGDESDDSDDDIEEFLFNAKKANKNADQNNFIVEEGDEPIDFLDRNAMSRIVSTKSGKQAVSARQVPLNNNGMAIDKKAFETNDEGKLVIVDDEEKKTKDRKRSRGASYLDEVFDKQSQEYEAKAGYRVTKAKGIKKREREEDSDDDEDDDIQEDLRSAFTQRTFATAKTGKTTRSMKSGMSNKDDSRSEKNLQRIAAAAERYNRVRGINTNVNLNEIGSQQKKGDVKKAKAKFEPYAYIPLDPKALNKRTKHNASSQFKTILKKRKN
ncbi:hypothetical protein SAMD00019534_090300 [Acytostelium subglobosum LB1]|uniref:hypothetical protein n=1 Tax=Acytostelium subglobosum LB1 TaxID=1410327 RepID=UPI000644DE84|nr:hypothetical protein SAMD00019534_090300 [Acytostelium subglobosum LB1]GAM25855.1 hypothetical protein SAMD00019534_090300 [Acytostelium subglobosum LB1]|eukprot:XP_012751373.1 hypothetical protein SAMD00019534_090300 [Acytostelium subglobosum LB1]